MKIIKNDFYNEVIYQETLENGLSVWLMPKKEYVQYSAIFMTNFGSFDTRFIPIGQSEYVDMPKGIAHFLEHKMFEMEDGIDATDIFSSMGIDANAYTSYDRTAYTINGTSNLDEAINLLLDFVQTPSFTTESIEKEKLIIEQELLMYLDKADITSNKRFMETLFGKNAKKVEDIGGTVESIKEIDKEKLMLCYNTFYHPSNMVLVITGGFDEKHLLEVIKENQSKKSYPKGKEFKRINEQFPENLEEVEDITYFNISRPIVSIGFTFDFEELEPMELLKRATSLNFLSELFFGNTSEFTQLLRKNGLGEIRYTSFVSYYNGYAYFVCKTTTDKYNKFIKAVKETINTMLHAPIDAELLESMKRAAHTANIKKFNSVDAICGDLAEIHFAKRDYFKELDVYKNIDVKDVENARNNFKDIKIRTHIVLPKQ